MTHYYDLSKVIKLVVQESTLKEHPSKSNHSEVPKNKTVIKNIFFDSGIKMSNPLKDLELSKKELKAIAKIRGIKG